MTSSGRHAPCTDRNGSGDKSSSISKCSVGISGGHFAGIFTLLTCRGSKGAHNVQWTLALCGPEQSGDVPSGKFRNSPKAGSGAEWLATLRNLPVIFPPLNRHPPSHIFPLRYQIKMEMTVVLWCRDRLWKKEKSSHFDRFSLSETGCSCITPIRSIGQSYAVSSTLSLFFALLVQSTHLPTLFCYIFLLFLSFFF